MKINRQRGRQRKIDEFKDPLYYRQTEEKR